MRVPGMKEKAKGTGTARFRRMGCWKDLSTDPEAI
jgi:hypothetical protein